MRILAHENSPEDAVAALRERDHDVIWVHSDMPGSSDADVLTCAPTEVRI